MYPLLKNTSDKIICNIIGLMFYISTYFNSKKIIMSKYEPYKKFKYIFSLKYNIFPRLFYSMKENEKFKTNMIIKFYKFKKENFNKESKILLSIFTILFIAIIIKEVILWDILWLSLMMVQNIMVIKNNQI